MELISARVTDFKSVLDSEWFRIGNLTALVGKNESGKTALLEALEKLNSVDAERNSFLNTDYPRMKLSDYENSEDVAVGVHSKWKLSDDEITAINEIVGREVLLSDEVTLQKDYANNLKWDVSLDYAAAIDAFLSASGLSESELNDFRSCSNTTDLLKKLRGIDSPSGAQADLLREVETRLPEGSLLAQAKALLKSWLPKFVYYSNYDRLPGRISINQLNQAKQQGNLESVEGSKVFLSLLSMVGTSPEEIADISTSEELIGKLEGVQSKISKEVFDYWSQNRHLKVRFRFGEGSPGDPPPFNSGKVFQTRIENVRHDATINLSERSTGFIWFFSFLVWFSEVQREHGERLIVLLDEPGLSLHGKAQHDLLRFIKEKLLTKYQVIYTTHSPFMIDSSNLLTCRTVEDVVTKDDRILGSKVGDGVLSTDRDTLFPLQAALGYDITQSLFIGEHSFLVEGPSDLLYIQWFSNALIELKRPGLDPRWTVTPCGGITKVFSFMSLFGGNRLHIAVLTDWVQGDKAKVRELQESALLRDGHVFTADMYANGMLEADTEDIIGPELYVDLVNATYGLKGKHTWKIAASDTSKERLTVRAKAHFQRLPPNVDEYDHFSPSKYLMLHGAAMSLPGLDAALDRFEKLFSDLNALL